MAAVRGKENRLEEIPATEEWEHIEALKKQVSGDGPPDKLSLLRQKLSQKAKHAAVGHPDGARPSGPDGDPVDPGADLRSRFRGLLLWVSSWPVGPPGVGG